MGYYQGDPVFGALLTRVLPKVLPKAGKAIGKLGGLIGRKGAPIKTAGKIAAGGAVFEVGARAARRVMDGGGARAYRRMNVGNVKALRRAIRRAKGFEKLSRQVLRFVSAKPPKGRAVFKKRRRS